MKTFLNMLKIIHMIFFIIENFHIIIYLFNIKNVSNSLLSVLL